MQISTRSPSVLILVLLAAGVRLASDPNSMPAAKCGAVVQGTVMGSGTQNMRVAGAGQQRRHDHGHSGGFV